jgi:hypothetical protein
MTFGRNGMVPLEMVMGLMRAFTFFVLFNKKLAKNSGMEREKLP